MNTGKWAEKAFEAFYEDKAFHLYRFEDYGDVNYRSGRNTRLAGKVGVSERPSDYLLTVEGQMSYVEVKSCSGKTSFPFKNIQGGQIKAAMKQTAARGDYWFVIYSVTFQQWFKVPASLVLTTKNEGRKSLAYKDIQAYRWPELERFTSTFTA